ncbi:hypothetical protein [Streptosporangium canum]|uniref:hypothetical protein n=1 Tax=Streptosporangium canum TaxID=324952 RepID=UPI0037978441
MKFLARGLSAAFLGVLLTAGCASSSGGGSVLLSERSTLKKNVPIDALLMTGEDLPSLLTEKLSLKSQNPDVKDIEILDALGAKEYRLRSWLDSDGARPIVQVILGFSNPSQANSEYQGMPNGRNFHIVDGLHAFPVDIRGLKLKADAANVFCVGFENPNGKVADCPQWGFRAQYEHNVIDVILRKSAGPEGYLKISKGLFLDLVVAVDQKISRR